MRILLTVLTAMLWQNMDVEKKRTAFSGLMPPRHITFEAK
jgi:hypothetical protein